MQLLTPSIWSDADHHHRPHTQSWISVLDPPFQMFLTAGKTSSTSKLCVHNCQPHPPRQQLPSWFPFFCLLSPPADQYQMCTTVTHILLHHLDFICTITDHHKFQYLTFLFLCISVSVSDVLMGGGWKLKHSIFESNWTHKLFWGKIDEAITCFILVRNFLLADELLLELCTFLRTRRHLF